MNSKYYEIIEKFIDNELDGEQLQWFQEQLRENKQFMEQCRLQLEVQEALQEEDVIRVRQKLDNIYSGSFEKQNPKYKIGWTKAFWIAASMALLIIGSIGLYSHLSNPGNSPSELYNQFYEPYETYTWVRSAEKGSMDMIGQALENYENNNYEKAWKLFSQVLHSNKDNLMASFYGAIAGMETGRHQESITLLKNIIKRGQSLVYQQAKWYLGLCYLKTGQNQEAKSVFISLGQESTYYKAKVKEILKNI